MRRSYADPDDPGRDLPPTRVTGGRTKHDGGQAAAQMLTEEPLLDLEYHAECAAETMPVPTMEEVLAISAKFPGGLVADFIAEQEER